MATKLHTSACGQRFQLARCWTRDGVVRLRGSTANEVLDDHDKRTGSEDDDRVNSTALYHLSLGATVKPYVSIQPRNALYQALGEYEVGDLKLFKKTSKGWLSCHLTTLREDILARSP